MSKRNFRDFIDTQRVNSRDKFFVTGSNPDNNGGGVIATTSTLDAAIAIKIEAIKAGFGKVQVLTSEEFWNE